MHELFTSHFSLFALAALPDEVSNSCQTGDCDHTDTDHNCNHIRCVHSRIELNRFASIIVAAVQN